MHVGCLGVAIAWILGHLAPPEVTSEHVESPQTRHLPLAAPVVAATPPLPESLQGRRRSAAVMAAVDAPSPGASLHHAAPTSTHMSPVGTPRAIRRYPDELRSVLVRVLAFMEQAPAFTGERAGWGIPQGRSRDIFPLPPLPRPFVLAHLGEVRAWHSEAILCIALYARLCIVGSNRLAGHNPPAEEV